MQKIAEISNFHRFKKFLQVLTMGINIQLQEKLKRKHLNPIIREPVVPTIHLIDILAFQLKIRADS